MGELRKRWMETKKTARGNVLLSFLQVISDQLFVKSLMGDLIMLWEPPISSTTPFLILSHLKQSGINSNKMTFVLLSRKNNLFPRRPTGLNILDFPDTMKTGHWRIGKGSCGQMRPKSTGSGQMEGLILGRRRGNHFLTELPPLQSNMEKGTILWYGVVWGGVE